MGVKILQGCLINICDFLSFEAMANKVQKSDLNHLLKLVSRLIKVPLRVPQILIIYLWEFIRKLKRNLFSYHSHSVTRGISFRLQETLNKGYIFWEYSAPPPEDQKPPSLMNEVKGLDRQELILLEEI